MSTNEAISGKQRFSQSVTVLISLAGGIFCLLTCAGVYFPLQFVLHLAVGWIAFVRRVAPRIEVNWSAIATAAACLAAVVVGGHWFLSWIYASRAPQAEAPRRRWRFSWTVGLTAATLVGFIAGICVIGIAHQTAWLARSQQPVVESTFIAFYRGESQKNLTQIGRGLVGYEQANSFLPVAATFDERGRPLHSWQTRLLPYIDHGGLYADIDLSLPWTAPENRDAFGQQVMPYVHLKDWSRNDSSDYAITSYAGNGWLLGGSRRWRTSQITDGTSTTIVCGEASTQPRAWGDPVNWRDPAEGIAATATSFGGAFHGVTLFTFADGRVTTISNRIDPAVFRALCTPTGGDRIQEQQGHEGQSGSQ